MARGGDDSGCGCLVLFFLACAIGGGVWQGVALLSLGWVVYLVFVGVSAGIVLAIIKAIAGD
jgi:hypothetical protein